MPLRLRDLTGTRPATSASADGQRWSDEGFTLVEILVSVVVISTVVAALGAFVSGSIRMSNLQTEQQLAVEVNTAGYERVHRMDPAGLLKDRDQSSVEDMWANPPRGVAPYLADMEAAWDDSAAPGTGPKARIPTSWQSTRVNGVQYSNRYFVGKCWQSTDGGPCDTSDPSEVEFFRVVISTTWPNTRCPNSVCSYVSVVLVSNAVSDPVFNTNTGPTVTPVPDQSNAAGSAIPPMTLTYTNGTAPVVWSITGQPPGVTCRPNGTISGTPTASGTYTVTVRASDANGKIDTRTFTWTVR